jgi:hypothetical protein
MRKLIRLYSRDANIRRLALIATAGLPSRDYQAEAAAIWKLVRARVRFVRDIKDLETLQTPLATLQQAGGDCDDHATLTGALLASLGHTVAIKIVDVGDGTGSGRPAGYSHVYLVDNIRGVPFPLDTTDPRFTPGTEVEAAQVKRSKVFEV